MNLAFDQANQLVRGEEARPVGRNRAVSRQQCLADAVAKGDLEQGRRTARVYARAAPYDRKNGRPARKFDLTLLRPGFADDLPQSRREPARLRADAAGQAGGTYDPPAGGQTARLRDQRGLLGGFVRKGTGGNLPLQGKTLFQQFSRQMRRLTDALNGFLQPLGIIHYVSGVFGVAHDAAEVVREIVDYQGADCAGYLQRGKRSRLRGRKI